MFTAWPQPTKGKPIGIWDIQGCLRNIRREFDAYAESHSPLAPAPVDPKYSRCKYGLAKIYLMELDTQERYGRLKVGQMSLLLQNLLPAIQLRDFARTSYIEMIRDSEYEGGAIALGSMSLRGQRGQDELSAAPEPTGSLGSIN